MRRRTNRAAELIPGFGSGNTETIPGDLEGTQIVLDSSLLTKPENKEALFKGIIVSTVFSIAGSLLFGTMLFFVSIPLVVGGIFFKASSAEKKKQASFEKEFPTFLIALASSLKTGADPLSAVLSSHEILPTTSPVRQEVIRVKEAVDDGISEEEAVSMFGVEYGSADVHLFKCAFILSRRHGSPLAPTLERLAKVVRSRQSFKRRVRSALAMQKMSSIGIGGCAAGVLLFQYITAAESIEKTLSSSVGFKVLLFGITLLAVGIFFLFKVANKRFL